MACAPRTDSKRSFAFLKFVSTVAALAALWFFALVAGARADFQSDIQAAAQKSAVKLSEIPALSGFLGNAAAKALGNLSIKNPVAQTGVLVGDATMPGLKFDVTFMLFKGQGPRRFFVGMKPKSTLKFSRLLGNVPGVQLLDVLSLGNQALFFTVTDQELASSDIPGPVRDALRPIFGTANYTLPLKQGVTFATGVDLGKSGPLEDALNFIGAQSTTIALVGSLSPNLLDALLEGKPPVPSVNLNGYLPAFKPRLGNKIRIPTNVTFGFNASLKAGAASVGYAGGFTLPIAGDDLQMTLNTAMSFDVKNPEPEVEVSMIMADGTPWRRAFGIKWLTIEDYTMSFNVKPSELGVGFSGYTTFGSKRFGVGGDAAWGAKTAGFPIPSGLTLSVDDGPDKIGSIALKDIVSVANEIVGAATGKRPFKPDLAPDMRLAGARKGEGPYIEIGNVTEPLNATISMGGEMIVLGKKLASVDHAFISPGEGVDIKAQTADLKIGGVLQMPTADVEIVLRAPDRETGEVQEPKILVKGRTAKMLGSGLEVELEVHKERQYAAADVTTLFNLFEAQVTMEGAADWRNPGFKVTGLVHGNIFNRLADYLQMAAADLVNATEAMIAGMNEEVHVFSQRLIQAKIDKDKVLDEIDAAADSARRELRKAQREVDRIRPKYERAKDKCSWKRPDKCVEEGALWLALKTAKGVLKAAEWAVDKVLAAARKGAEAVLNALEKTINGLGHAINKATDGLTKAFKAVGKVVSFAANVVGDALEGIASVFEIQKLWMGGELAALNDRQTGNLGIEFRVLSKTYLHETAWNFNNPIEDFVKLVTGGDEPTGNEKTYSTAPATRTTQKAQDMVEAMIEKASYEIPPMPYNPRTCEVYPYLLDEQIAEARLNLDALTVTADTNLLSAYVAAYEQAPNRKALQPGGIWKAFLQNLPHNVAYTMAKHALAIDKRHAIHQRKSAAAQVRKVLKRRGLGHVLNSAQRKVIAKASKKFDNAHREIYDIAAGLMAHTSDIQKQYRERRNNPRIKKAQENLQKVHHARPRVSGIKGIQKLVKWQRRVAAAHASLVKTIAAENKRNPLRLRIKVDGRDRNIKPPYMSYQDKNYFAERKKELTDLLNRLRKLKRDPVSVCGQATEQAGIKDTGADQQTTQAAALAGLMGIAQINKKLLEAIQAAREAQIKKARAAQKTLKARRLAWAKKKHAKMNKALAAKRKARRAIHGNLQKERVAAAQKAVATQQKRIVALQKRIKAMPTAQELRKRMIAQFKAATMKLPFGQSARINIPKIKVPSERELARKLAARKKGLQNDLKAARAELRTANAQLAAAQKKPSAKQRGKRRLVGLSKKAHAGVLRELRAKYGKSRRFKAIAHPGNAKAAALAMKDVIRQSRLQAALKKIDPKDKGDPRDTTFLGNRLKQINSGVRALNFRQRKY